MQEVFTRGEIIIHIDAPLHFFLPRDLRRRTLVLPLDNKRSIKDFVESLGIPHVEVDRLLVNGSRKGFDYHLAPDDEVSVTAPLLPIDLTQESERFPAPMSSIRFVLDVHLGRLARYLRLLGFDSWYKKHASDSELATISVREKRLLLTRDVELLKRKELEYGYCLRTTRPRAQLAEVAHRFGLGQRSRPYCRCISCNALLRDASKQEVRSLLPAGVAKHFTRFRQCQGCGKAYWEGSHYRRLETIIAEVCDPPMREGGAGE